jgi:hypothetical protein
VSIADETDGVLANVGAPVVLVFSEPIVEASLSAEIVTYTVDAEGNLADEDADEATKLEVRFGHAPGKPDVGGTSQLQSGGRALSIHADPPLPVGPALAALIEPGLADAAGNATKTRQRLKFAYAFRCDDAADAGPVSASLPTGAYFMLVEVDEPIATQVQLFSWLEVDAATGRVRGQFTNGDRNPDPDRCPTPCKSTEACRLLPAPDCVAPSTKAGSVDEFSDWVANSTPPTGFTFTVTGCTRDQPDGTIAFATDPVDTKTQSPPVTSHGITMSGVLAAAPDGVLRGTGSFSVEEVFLGSTPSGPGRGSLRMRMLSGEETPKDLPKPP